MPEGHLRRYGGYAEYFDMSWTLTSRQSSGFHRGVLPEEVQPVWLPGFGSGRSWLRTVPRLVRVLWKTIGEHDGVLVNVPSFAALPALLIARVRRTPAVALQLSRWEQLRRHPNRVSFGQRLLVVLLTQMAVLLATHTYVVGAALVGEIWPILRRRTTTIVYPAIDEGDLADPGQFSSPRPGDPVVLLTVARFIATKRLDAVVLTVKTLRERGYDTRATIVGDGVVRPAIETLIGEHELDSFVDLRGWVDDWDELRALYTGCSAFLFTSEDEGLPLVIMEAMARGAPIVSTPAGGLAGWLVDGEDAMVVPRPDPQLLADAVVRLITSPDLRCRLQRHGWEKARAHTRERWLDWFAGELRRAMGEGAKR